jgi:hypothetical protein
MRVGGILWGRAAAQNISLHSEGANGMPIPGKGFLNVRVELGVAAAPPSGGHGHLLLTLRIDLKWYNTP